MNGAFRVQATIAWRRLYLATKGVVAVSAISCSSEGPVNRIIGRATDSAGVRGVIFDSLPSTSPSEEWGHAVLTIGVLSENDSLEFDPRATYRPVAQGADGSIIVGDHQRLKYFSRTGALIRIVGRGGYGPGEFSHSIRDLCPQRDSSLVVVDDGGRRSHWSPSGTALATYERQGVIPRGGCWSDGMLIVKSGESKQAERGGERGRSRYDLVAINGSLIREFGWLPEAVYFPQVWFEMSVLLYKDVALVCDPFTATMSEQRVSDGTELRRVVFRNATAEIGQEAWDSMLQAGVPRRFSAAQRARHLARVGARGRPSRLPAFERIAVDALVLRPINF